MNILETYRLKVISIASCPHCEAPVGLPCVNVANLAAGIKVRKIVPYVHDDRSAVAADMLADVPQINPGSYIICTYYKKAGGKRVITHAYGPVSLDKGRAERKKMLAHDKDYLNEGDVLHISVNRILSDTHTDNQAS